MEVIHPFFIAMAIISISIALYKYIIDNEIGVNFYLLLAIIEIIVSTLQFKDI